MTKKISFEEIMEIYPTITIEKMYELERKIEIFDEYIEKKRTCYQVIDSIHNIGLSTFFAQIKKYKEGGIMALIHKSTAVVNVKIKPRTKVKQKPRTIMLKYY